MVTVTIRNDNNHFLREILVVGHTGEETPRIVCAAVSILLISIGKTIYDLDPDNTYISAPAPGYYDLIYRGLRLDICVVVRQVFINGIESLIKDYPKMIEYVSYGDADAKHI